MTEIVGDRAPHCPTGGRRARSGCRSTSTRDDLAPWFAGADAVIHLAWLIQPSRDDAELERVNVHGSRRVFEAAAEAGVPALVHASSVGVYSPGPEGPRGRRVLAARGCAEPLLLAPQGAGRADARRARGRHPDAAHRAAAARADLQARGRSGDPAPVRRPVPARPRCCDPVACRCCRCRRGSSCSACTATDVGEAYRLAALSPDARGAYNIAADPVLDQAELARVLMRPRRVTVPARLVRAARRPDVPRAPAAGAARLAGHGPGRADDGHAPGARGARLDADADRRPRRCSSCSTAWRIRRRPRRRRSTPTPAGASASARCAPASDPASEAPALSHPIAPTLDDSALICA